MNNKKAKEHYDKAYLCYRFTNYGDALVEYGKSNYWLGKYDEAIADFTHAIELYKGNNNKAEAYYNRGIAYAEQEKYAEAIADYDKSMELYNDDIDVKHIKDMKINCLQKQETTASMNKTNDTKQ